MNRRKLFPSLFLLLTISFYPFVGHTQITFQKTFGGVATDYAYAVQQLGDEGYAIAGFTESFGEGSRDIYLLRTDIQGNLLWTKTYGNTNTDYAWAMDQTNDGGFILGAHSESSGAGGHDVNLIRTDAEGNLLWAKVYGGSSADGAYSLLETAGGGFVVAAHTSSFGEGQHEFYLLKTDTDGELLWTKTYGNTSGDFLRGLNHTPDLGFIMVGETYSFGAGGADIYVVRTDAQGDTIWTRTFGGDSDDFGSSISLTNDQAYIIAGHTRSFGQGQLDVLLMKIDDHGDILWARTYGGPDEDYAHSVQPTADGGYILSGATKSFAMGGFCDIKCNDVYLIKTDADGDTLWTRAYGSLSEEHAWSVWATTDGGYTVVGTTTGFGAKAEDIYFIKTDAKGNTGCAEKGTATGIGTPDIEVNSPQTIIGQGAIESATVPLTGAPLSIENTLCMMTDLTDHPSWKGIKLYPNPTNGSLWLEGQSPKLEIQSVEVFGLSGKKIIQRTPGNGSSVLELHLPQLLKGLYFLKILTNQGVLIRKVLYN